ncbi:MAG: ATP-binding protein [Actinomycetota bacterium]|nr:hybrid sensor histidine kinase/response regulator [Actinomycetota bacterium]
MGANVLVIEDNPGDARLIEIILKQEGFNVELAGRLSEGLDRLAGNGIDVVLLDLSLPDGQGMENFSRTQATAPTVPVIVLTGLDDENTAMRAVNEGAQDYLVKGTVDGQVIARSIRYGIERHRMVAELRRLDAAKTQFIADAAHELRTPLSTLGGFAQMLSMHRHTMSEEQLEQAFDAIGRQSEHVATLVNNLLDLSQIEHGSLRLELGPVDIDGAAQRAIEVAPAPPGRSVNVDAQGARVLADQSRLDQVLVNLLTNAYRYGGPEIRIGVEDDDPDVLVSVSDNGPGVPESVVPRLFEPFARGSNTGATRGSGLGLAIVRKLIEASGGTIWYEPGRPVGARFVIRLRKA